MAKNLYFIEVTDMYGGEANFSWVTRHIIKAKSERGAIQALSIRSGLHWSYDGTKYVSDSGATCAFVDVFDNESHGDLRIDNDDRND